MIKRPFFSLGRPKLKYPVVEELDREPVKEIALPGRLTLLLKRPPAGIPDASLFPSPLSSPQVVLKRPSAEGAGLDVRPGDGIRTGQRLRLAGEAGYLTSTATGTVTNISGYFGYLGQKFTSISVDAAETDQWEDRSTGEGEAHSFEDAIRSLGSLPPGDPSFSCLMAPRFSPDTIIINGLDRDLLITTNQRVVKTDADLLAEGVARLKERAGSSRIIIIVPAGLIAQAEKTGAEVAVVGPYYPSALPHMVMKDVLGRIVPAGGRWEDLGVAFINAERVAALAIALSNGHLPVTRMLTVIDKDYSTVNVKARIGTPVKDILDTLNIEIVRGDRLVLGGPMTGIAAHSEDVPVLSDTDAIMVQAEDQIIPTSDCHCVNCGECVRACPASIPVNMLVRLLENGLYQDAATEYDLHSCIECGLCSYVCIARIPIFQYIMLGKSQLASMGKQEDAHA